LIRAWIADGASAELNTQGTTKIAKVYVMDMIDQIAFEFRFNRALDASRITVN